MSALRFAEGAGCLSGGEVKGSPARVIFAGRAQS